MSFFNELKRRNVIRTAGLYVAGVWLILQVAGTVLPMVDAPVWLSRGIVVALTLGFVPALVFAWAFELTPDGLKRESEVERTESVTAQTGKKMDRLIMVALALALGYFAFDKFVLAPQREAELQQQMTEALDAARKEGRSEALVESYGDKSIAVLPFVNMSNDPEQEYFSDGISEELLNLMAKIPHLRVISRSSAFYYKGKDIKLAQVAAELKVAHVLEGSVRKSGNHVRITAQLIEARSDTHLWSQTWDRELTDIFAVQDEIAGAVVRQLKITLLGAAPMAKETDPRAYALFLQGRQLNRQGTPDAWEQAISLNQQVLAIDPAYVPAWNNLALIYGNQAGNGLRPVDAGFRLAREAASKALAIDADYAPAYSRLGWIAMMYEGDLAAAARHYEHALALEPANLGIINDAAILAVILGRLDTAISLLEYAADRDPVNPAGHDNVGNAYLLAGRLDEAITSFRATLSLSPGFMASRSRIGMALLLKGEPEAALAAMRQESYPYWQLIGMATACHTLGQKVASDAALKQLIEKHQKDSAYNIASVLAWRAEPDRAFAWLDKAVASHDTSMPEIAVQPLFADLHSDSRWLPFLRKLGKAPEQLAAIKFDVKVPQ